MLLLDLSRGEKNLIPPPPIMFETTDVSTTRSGHISFETSVISKHDSDRYICVSFSSSRLDLHMHTGYAGSHMQNYWCLNYNVYMELTTCYFRIYRYFIAFIAILI